MKKVLSTVLVVAMLLSLVPTFAFAENATSVITLIDFGNPAEFEPALCEHPTAEASAFAYPGKTSSLRYVMTGTDVNVPINTEEQPLSQYNTADATLNIRFYSEAVDSQFNIVYLNTNDTSKYFPVPGNNNRPTIVGGWQTFTVPFSSVYAQTGDAITLRLNDFGWGNKIKNLEEGILNGYNQGDIVYVDSVWIDTEAEYDSMKDPESLVIWDPEKGDGDFSRAGRNELDPYGARGKYHNFEKEQVIAAALARNMTRVEENGIKNDYYTPVCNTGEYNWFNVWVYSPNAQDSGFSMRISSKLKSTANVYNYVNDVKMEADDHFHLSVMQVDWKGWKLISVPAPANKDIIAITLSIGNRSYADFHSFPEKNIPLKVGFDGIWLSKGDVSPQAQWEASRESGKIMPSPYRDSDIPVADFNEASKLQGGLNHKITNDNPHIYDTAARMSWVTAPTGDFSNITNSDRKAQVNIFGTNTNSTDIIPVTENSYVNLWMYNPEVKYTKNGTDYAEFSVVMCYWNGKNVASPVAVMANWTGWKLISIPVKLSNDLYNGDFVKYGINCIYVGANIGWYGKETVRSDEEKANGYVWGYPNHFISAQLDYNRRCYLDIERVWISDGPVTEGADITRTAPAEKICLESDHYDMASLFTSESDILDLNVKYVKTADASAEVANITYSSDGYVVFEDGLNYGESYSVVAEFYAADGVKYTEEFIIKTENFHVVKNETSNSITLTMHGIVPWEYSGAVMIAAVYDKESNEMLKMIPEYVEDDTVSVEVADFDEATQKIKFIFIENFENMKPLYKDIIA